MHPQHANQPGRPYEPGHAHTQPSAHYPQQQYPQQHGYGQAAWAPPQPQKSSPLKHVAGYTAAVLLSLLVGIGIGSSGSGDTVTADPSSGGADPSASAATGTAGTKETKAADGAPGIGAAVRDGKFQFTVTKVKGGVSKVGDQYLGKKAQGQFVLVSITVENIGDEPRTFDSSSQTLFDSSGKEYSADGEAEIYLGETNSFLEKINPGNKVDGIVVFDVPESGFKPGKIELHDSALSGGVEIALV